jgi:hypothetical protein
VTSPARNILAKYFPPDVRLLRAYLISAALALIFLVGTAYQSAATLLSRVEQTDVMKAAAGGAWSGQIAMEISYFLFAQVVLHLAFAGLAWLLACASIIVWPAARAKFGRTVVAWFCMLATATIVYNALWYPRTLIGAWYHDAVATSVGPVAVGEAVYLGIMIFAAGVLGSAAFRVAHEARVHVSRRTLMFCVPVLVFGIAAGIWPAARSKAMSAASQQRPNIIILGIDSLRLENLSRFGGNGVTPNLDRFLSEALVVKDTTTPAARTFPSWVAILTGRSPPVNGARFNLADRATVAANPTFADVLRGIGYRTIYSTDDVRFANIDESYGFDQVITPPIGAADFLIGSYNELPLASVVINTRLGQVLFPFSYANRGVATMFQPRTYLSRVDRELSFEKPTLFIAHLTASHWPYYVSDTPFGMDHGKSDDDRPLYRVGLETADSMFGQLVSLLKRKGAMDNAIVIVLSDHGEALGLPNDTYFPDGTIIEGLHAPLKLMDSGHGQSVLSPTQFQVLLGFRTFGPNRAFIANGRDLDCESTVEDIAPTILDLLHVSGNPLKATGTSLAPILRTTTSNSPMAEDERIRFTETDLAVLPGPNGTVDEVATAKQNAKFFEIDTKTARMHIRDNWAPLAIAYKERSAFTGHHVLAAIPAGPYAQQYIYVDKTSGSGRLLMSRPGDEDVEAQRLWDALSEHYPGEMHRPVSTKREDWPVLDKEWGEFLAKRDAGKASGIFSN